MSILSQQKYHRQRMVKYAVFGKVYRCVMISGFHPSTGDNVFVMAYNMGFEKGRIKRMAELYPNLAEHLMAIHDHIVDLMVPFKQRAYYCRAMQGSYSIKYVLPALFPDDPVLDYHNLEGVHNGAEASDVFSRMKDMDSAEREECRKNLLKYCELDTLAMVKIWQKLKMEN